MMIYLAGISSLPVHGGPAPPSDAVRSQLPDASTPSMSSPRQDDPPLCPHSARMTPLYVLTSQNDPPLCPHFGV